MRLRAGKTHDADGKLAARGKADEKIVEKILDDPFFSKKPPKSLDRATFAKFPLESLSDEDAAATATAIVAASIAKSFDYLPKKPVALIAAGGGAQNPTLMAMLRARTSISVKTANEVGWRADAIEAQAFAYLAVRVLKGLPLTFPTTTGVRQPMTGGVITRPE
jgi:anhydro-N-acetylmuramic acid kinase